MSFNIDDFELSSPIEGGVTHLSFKEPNVGHLMAVENAVKALEDDHHQNAMRILRRSKDEAELAGRPFDFDAEKARVNQTDQASTKSIVTLIAAVCELSDQQVEEMSKEDLQAVAEGPLNDFLRALQKPRSGKAKTKKSRS